MEKAVTFLTFEKALKKAGLKYITLNISEESFIVITEHWGKIFGPFQGREDPGTLWISDRVRDAQEFMQMVDNNDWCVGGDRIWLAPEVQYNIPDRINWDADGAYSLPQQIDPGVYTLTRISGEEVRLVQSIETRLHNLAFGSKKLYLERIIRPALDPLRCVKEYTQLRGKVKYAGYTQEIEIEDLSPDDARTEIWNLLQFYPGGVVVLPATSMIEYQDYYEPIDENYLRIDGKTVFLRFTGDRKYKVGFQGAGFFGRVGYYQKIQNNMSRLVIRNFFNNPSSAYVDEPAGTPGGTGDSVQFYNDDGGLGGFSEVEIQGLAIGGNTGRTVSRDVFDFWQYVGQEEDILTISDMLLGIAEITF